MQEIRYTEINGKKTEILISDDREALLAAKAAGRAIIGVGPNTFGIAPYAVQDPGDADDTFLERTARRHLGLPWRICETKRLLIREIYKDDFDVIWQERIGRGFGTVEELEAYTENHYKFYEFGFWAVVEKESGELAGVAGLTVPRGKDGEQEEDFVRLVRPWPGPTEQEAGNSPGSAPARHAGPEAGNSPDLELAYHIFPRFRRKGYAHESCLAIMEYGHRELGAERYLVRIRRTNAASLALAETLGFSEETDEKNKKVLQKG